MGRKKKKKKRVYGVPFGILKEVLDAWVEEEEEEEATAGVPVNWKDWVVIWGSGGTAGVAATVVP